MLLLCADVELFVDLEELLLLLDVVTVPVELAFQSVPFWLGEQAAGTTAVPSERIEKKV